MGGKKNGGPDAKIPKLRKEEREAETNDEEEFIITAMLHRQKKLSSAAVAPAYKPKRNGGRSCEQVWCTSKYMS